MKEKKEKAPKFLAPENTVKPEKEKVTAGAVFAQIGKWIYRLRSILLAIPVGVAAVILAIRNMAKLPVKVGFDLQSSGEFTYLVSRNVAVLGPLAVTALCLLFMFCSKRVTYPWLISIFSLLLPVVILLVNTFPG